MVVGAAARGDEAAALQRRLYRTQDQVRFRDDAEAGYERNADTRGGKGAGHAEVTGLRDHAGGGTVQSCPEKSANLKNLKGLTL